MLPHNFRNSKRRFHLLRYIGAGMMVSTVVIYWLMVLKIITASLLVVFVSYILFLLGAIFVLVGNSYNTRADRSD